MPARSRQRGSVPGSIAGIVVCGGLGAVAAWAAVTQLGLTGATGALLAVVLAMAVAFAVWTGGSVLLRAFRSTR